MVPITSSVNTPQTRPLHCAGKRNSTYPGKMGPDSLRGVANAGLPVDCAIPALLKVGEWPVGRALRVIDCSDDSITLYDAEGPRSDKAGLLPEPSPGEILLIRNGCEFMWVDPDSDALVHHPPADDTASDTSLFSAIAGALEKPAAERAAFVDTLRKSAERCVNASGQGPAADSGATPASGLGASANEALNAGEQLLGLSEDHTQALKDVLRQMWEGSRSGEQCRERSLRLAREFERTSAPLREQIEHSVARSSSDSKMQRDISALNRKAETFSWLIQHGTKDDVMNRFTSRMGEGQVSRDLRASMAEMLLGLLEDGAWHCRGSDVLLHGIWQSAAWPKHVRLAVTSVTEGGELTLECKAAEGPDADSVHLYLVSDHYNVMGVAPQRQDVAADGNCLFHAVTAGLKAIGRELGVDVLLSDDEAQHEAWRRLAVATIAGNADLLYTAMADVMEE